jgi:ABC-2 type transport system permease protein
VTTVPAGAVYDRGYRPYDGERLGRGGARLALVRASMRRALGIRRPWRQKVLPWGLLVIAVLPAIVNVGVGYITRDSPIEDFEWFSHREYVGVSTALLLFVALTAPDIICPDRRSRVLPLIFARPLDSRDYVAAKVGAMAAIVFGFAFVPQVVLFVGQMLVRSEGALEYFTDHAWVLWKAPLAIAALSLYYAAIGVALAATTTRRIVGGVAVLGLLLVTSTVAGILVEVNDGKSAWALVNVLALPLHVRDLIFLGRVGRDGALSGVAGAGVAAVAAYSAILLACLGYLLWRYRDEGG